jgi:hypothetical protein
MRIPPATPNEVSTAFFGRHIMKWGVGKRDAIARIATISAAELIRATVTCDILEQWRDFYLAEVSRIPRNATAKARADLMEHCLKLLQC